MEVSAPPPIPPAAGKGIAASPSVPQGPSGNAAAPIDGVDIELIDGILTAADSSRARVLLRLLPPLPAGTDGDALTAQVVAGPGAGILRLITALGTIVPQRPLAATIGSIIRFALIARVPLGPEPQPTANAAHTTAGPPDAAANAAELATDLLNDSGLQRLTAALLLLAATPTGLVRVRDAIVRRLRGDSEKAGGDDLGFLSHGGWQITEAGTGALWRVLPFPWPQFGLGDACVLRRERHPRPAGPGEEPVRFMLEVSLRQFGLVQLDGLYRRQRFDLVLRSHAAFTAEIRGEAMRRFTGALATGGLKGGLAFSIVSRFAIGGTPEPKALGIEV
jgi:hypothetical protein